MKHKRGQTFVFGEDTERQRATNQQQREKKMVILLKITKVMNLRHISFSPTSNQRGVARCCQLQAVSTAVIKKRSCNSLDPTMARVHQLALCMSNEGTEPARSLSSSHFVQAHAETSICIFCLQVIDTQGSCKI